MLFELNFIKISSLGPHQHLGESNPRHSGGKPKHCTLSYRTHADNSYINRATYNNFVILDLNISQKCLMNVVFGHFISINVFRGGVGLVRVVLK